MHRVELPDIGVTLFVDNAGVVSETSWWSAGDWYERKDVWKEVRYLFDDDGYSLAAVLPDVEKVDAWFDEDGGLSVFALLMDGRPVLAEFDYADGGYAFIQLVDGAPGETVVLEAGGYEFEFSEDAGEMVARKE